MQGKHFSTMVNNLHPSHNNADFSFLNSPSTTIFVLANSVAQTAAGDALRSRFGVVHMPVLTIDGRTIETQPGKTIIEAANDNGITIPHFCWHPSLSVAGNCRMCLVNVGSPKKAADGQVERDADGNPVVAWMPKLQIACATPVSEGMIVSTRDDKSHKASNAVMEFLLVNHPLDCPICDEAGQCKLQEYAFKYSKGESRFVDEKNHKDKRVQWGPNVMFDGERCISCSRCIRYATEIAHQPVLSFVQRGDHVTIETFEGTQFDSPYSMNVIELCPVGALTSIDFRFKARVWDMSFNESICHGCARGCNIQVGVRNNTILRLEPRSNPYVNQYWMCDEGRLSQFKWVNENRLSGASINKNGSQASASWKDSLKAVANQLNSASSITILLGSSASNEDAFAATKLAAGLKAKVSVVYRVHNDAAFGDDFLRVADRVANSQGFEAMGIRGLQDAALAQQIASTDLLLNFGDDGATASAELRSAMQNAKHRVYAGTNAGEIASQAHVVLAAASYAEAEGTVTSHTKRVQHYTPAVISTENLRIMGMKMSRLDRFGAANDRWNQGERRDCRQYWTIAQGIARELGHEWSWSSSEDVFREMQTKHSGFAGMDYRSLDARHGIKLGAAHEAEAPVVIYESHDMKPN